MSERLRALRQAVPALGGRLGTPFALSTALSISISLVLAISGCARIAPQDLAVPSPSPTTKAAIADASAEAPSTLATEPTSLATTSPAESDVAADLSEPAASLAESTPFVTAVAPASPSAEGADEPDRHAAELAFVPGSLDVAFTVTKGYVGGSPALFVQRAGSSGAATGAPEVLATLPEGTVSYRDVVASAPAGRMAVLTQDDVDGGRSRVLVLSSDGADLRDLTREEIHPLSIDWLPDGSALEVLTEEAELLTIDPESGERRVIATGLVGEYGGPAATTAWSPDARRVILASIDASLRPRLELVDPRAGTRAPLASIDGASRLCPAFSMDGAALFVLVERQGTSSDPSEGAIELWTVSPEPAPEDGGSEPRRLATLPIPTGLAPEVVVHPDGEHLYLLLDHRLWRIGTDGAGLALVAGDEEAKVDGPLAFTRSASGEERLAWTSRAFHGPAPEGVDPRSWASTTRRIQTVDPRTLPGGRARPAGEAGSPYRAAPPVRASTSAETATSATDGPAQDARSSSDHRTTTQGRAPGDLLADALESKIYVEGYGWVQLAGGNVMLAQSAPHESRIYSRGLTALPERHARGDLNQDGRDDLALFFAYSGWSSPSRAAVPELLVAFVSDGDDGGARFAGSVVPPLSAIEEMRIEGGEIWLRGVDERTISLDDAEATLDAGYRNLARGTTEPWLPEEPPHQTYRRALRYRLTPQEAPLAGWLSAVVDRDLGDVDAEAVQTWMPVEPFLAETGWRWLPDVQDPSLDPAQLGEIHLFIDEWGLVRVQLPCGRSMGSLRQSKDFVQLSARGIAGGHSCAEPGPYFAYLERLSSAEWTREVDGVLEIGDADSLPLRFVPIPFEEPEPMPTRTPRTASP